MGVFDKASAFKAEIERLNGTSAVRTPVNVLGAVAQFAHETGNFSSRAMMENWNLAGIKCTKSWVKGGGACFSAKTWEERGGEVAHEVAGFRSYKNFEHFMYDYSRLIGSYYPLSAKSVDCVWLFFAGLHGKWATDSNYFRALVRMACRLAPHLGVSRADLENSLHVAFERGWPEKWMAVCVADAVGAMSE